MSEEITKIYVQRDFDEDIEVNVLCDVYFERDYNPYGGYWYSEYQSHKCKEYPELELTKEEIERAEEKARDEHVCYLQDMQDAINEEKYSREE